MLLGEELKLCLPSVVDFLLGGGILASALQVLTSFVERNYTEKCGGKSLTLAKEEIINAN